MFIITHVPSKTMYGIHSNEKTSVICCKNYKDALHISNSLYTYKKLNQKNPLHTKIFFYSRDEGQQLYNSLEAEYNVCNVYPNIDEYMMQLSKNNLSMLFVHCISPKIHTTHLRLKKKKRDTKDEFNELLNLEY